MTIRLLQRNAFSFLECLVVMFTIVLLASIVLPGINHVEKELTVPVLEPAEIEMPKSPAPSPIPDLPSDPDSGIENDSEP